MGGCSFITMTGLAIGFLDGSVQGQMSSQIARHISGSLSVYKQ